MLFNVGFKEAMKDLDWDCLIFHDVDHLMENDRNYYGCTDMPRHFAVKLNKYSYMWVLQPPPSRDWLGRKCNLIQSDLMVFLSPQGFRIMSSLAVSVAWRWSSSKRLMDFLMRSGVGEERTMTSGTGEVNTYTPTHMCLSGGAVAEDRLYCWLFSVSMRWVRPVGT